jgi:hypothetical protein
MKTKDPPQSVFGRRSPVVLGRATEATCIDHEFDARAEIYIGVANERAAASGIAMRIKITANLKWSAVD